MASLIPVHDAEVYRVLDPAAGAGILACSAARELVRRHAKRIQVQAYEINPRLARMAIDSLREVRGLVAEDSTDFAYQVHVMNFFQSGTKDPILDSHGPPRFDVVILNPPYYKVGKETRSRFGLHTASVSHTNVYTLFLTEALRVTSEPGYVIAITPRSWFSGAYFRRFRGDILAHADLTRIHSFIRRDEAFREEGVLQETTIFVLEKRANPVRPDVLVSTSWGRADLTNARTFVVPWSRLSPRGSDGVIRIPETLGQLDALRSLDSAERRLGDLGLEVSTGPVVGFRSRRLLTNTSDPPNTVPLVWSSHVTLDGFRWPGTPQPKHPSHIRVARDSRLYVGSDEDVVLVRRFSAKEDARRVIACHVRGGELGGPFAVENHLNVIRGFRGSKGTQVAAMLSRYLNSEQVDDWFRAVSGTTQINARDLRDLPVRIPGMAPHLRNASVISDWS
jgi:adenine-specific DNA-methyltransferase